VQSLRGLSSTTTWVTVTPRRAGCDSKKETGLRKEGAGQESREERTRTYNVFLITNQVSLEEYWQSRGTMKSQVRNLNSYPDKGNLNTLLVTIISSSWS
jgi:hypothetical protein